MSHYRTIPKFQPHIPMELNVFPSCFQGQVLTCFKDPKAIETLNNYLYLVGNSIDLLAWVFKDFPNKLGTKKDDTTEKVRCFVEFQIETFNLHFKFVKLLGLGWVLL